jgi:hypothetical protein
MRIAMSLAPVNCHPWLRMPQKHRRQADICDFEAVESRDRIGAVLGIDTLSQEMLNFEQVRKGSNRLVAVKALREAWQNPFSGYCRSGLETEYR